MKYLKVSLFLVIIYVYINNPFFRFLHGLSSLYLFVPFLIFLADKNIRSFLFKIKGYVLLLFAVFLFCIFRSALGGDPVYIRTSFFKIITFAFLPVIFLRFIYRNSLSFDKIINYFGWTCVIITTICVLNPTLNNFFTHVITIPAESTEDVSFRGFGLSSNLSSGYGTVLVVTYVFFVYKKLFKKKINYLIIPFIFLSIIVNARTSAIVLCLVMICQLGLSIYKYMILFFVIFLFMAVAPSISEIPFLPYETSLWVQLFFDEIQDILLGTSNTDKTTLDVIINNHLVFPQNTFQWFLGRGYNIFNIGSENSDIGFLRQINYGGIIYLILLLLPFLYLMRKVSNNYLLVCSLIIFIIINTKGDFLSGQDGYRLLNLIILNDLYKSYINKISLRKCL